MPVTPDAVSHLQAAGHDAIHASSVGLAQATDPEIIEIARRDGRVVVTADLDYPRLVLLSDAAGPGIVLSLTKRSSRLIVVRIPYALGTRALYGTA